MYLSYTFQQFYPYNWPLSSLPTYTMPLLFLELVLSLFVRNRPVHDVVLQN